MKIYTCFPHGKTKALTMSYDDGRLQDERLVGIFNRQQRNQAAFCAARDRLRKSGFRCTGFRAARRSDGMASNLPSQYIGSDGTGRIFC